MKSFLFFLFIANLFAFSNQDPGTAALQIHIEETIKEKPTLYSALAHFAQESLKIDVSEKQIHFLKGGSGKGLSGALIYVIHNEKEEPVLVIKAFPSSQEKEFLDESFALSHFENLSLKDLSFPYLKRTDRYTIQGKTFFFVGMTYVRGASLSALLDRLRDPSLSIEERKAYLQTLLPVFGKLGRGLAQFHLTNRGKPKPLNPLLIETLRHQGYEWLEASKEDFDTNVLENMRNLIDKTFDHISSISYFSTYIHGDANLSNYLYDKNSDTLTMLDVTSSARFGLVA